MLILLRILCMALGLQAILPLAPVQAADALPILQLDPGGHMARINDIAFTPDGRFLVSASDDKTVRVWDVQRPGAPRVIRGQVGDGHEGKIFAMALSPDGRTMAVGGWLTSEESDVIRLYDLATGRVLGLLSGHTNVVNALAFSPDGQQLISGSGDFTAILWDVPNHTLLQRLEGHTNDIYAVAFTPDGQRVVTGSDDHDLRLWAVADGQLIARMTGHTDEVQSVAVAADGTIASGGSGTSILLWNGNTGQFIKILAEQGTEVDDLSFSPDGQWLLSGVGDGPDTDCHLWDVATGQELQRYAGHDNIVLATAFAPAGNLVATAGGNNQEIHLWNPSTGELQQRLTGGGASTWAVGIAADGSSIAWGNQFWSVTNSATQLEYQLPLALAGTPQLGSPTAVRAGTTWQRATPTFGTWSLRHTKGGDYGYDAILEIRRKKKTHAKIERGSTDGYRHRAYTFTPDGNTIISGGSHGVLTAYARSGNNLGDFVGHTGDVLAVAVSGDGRLLVSGSDDQTVRVWNVATRELLLTVFHKNPTQTPPPSPLPLTGEGGKNPTPALPLTGEGENLNFPPVKGGLRGVIGEWVAWLTGEGENLNFPPVKGGLRGVKDLPPVKGGLRGVIGEWVAWTPQGYYAASANGDKMVGWQINRGPDQTPDFIEASQLRERFYRPDILAQAINLGSAEQAVADAKNTTVRLEQLAQAQPPKFQVLQPNDGTSTSTSKLELVLDIPPQAEDTPLERVDIYVNGRLANLLRLGKMALPQQEGGTRPNYSVGLQPGENHIRIVAKNRIGETARELTVHLKSTQPAPQGDLYLVSIGVSDYANNSLDLRFAAADARDFHRTILQQTKDLYKKVHEKLLISEATGNGSELPTANNIRDALDMFAQAAPNDVLILFIAGHGTNESNGYYFLPQDAAERNGHWKSSSTIRWTDIQNVLVDAKGQRILFVDTCHSGAAMNTRLIKDASDANILVFSATDANTPAQEMPELGHGVFTYAILEGLGGKADMLPTDQRVMLKELDAYTSSRVTELTHGSQVTTIQTPGGFRDMVFGLR